VEVTEGDPAGAANLEKVDHVVVVMLENRSFDYMLGYLSLSGRRPEIDGLRPGLANQYQGRGYPVHHLDTTAVQMDPDHSAAAIDRQIDGGIMSGFVASAAATLVARGTADGDPGCVMGYYDGTDVPVYDHLAEQFAVCDRWFASVPGATLPNRLYALSGAAAGSRDDRPAYVPPLYHQRSFVQYLDSHHISWRWYSFDPGTLRLADARYRLGHHDRFGYLSKTGLPWKTVFNLTVNAKIPSFLEDAAAGTLRQVSWIDPAFTNFNPLGFPVNDDHPPADIKDGQDLVLAVYDALASSSQWDHSLLVVVYDENGGFYDHVPPPQAADDKPEMFGSYGVRVPAIIVSPWIEPRTVSHTLFDHTSIIKTILLRFCPGVCDPPQAQEGRPRLSRSPHYPGARVAQASHLGELLTRATPRPAPPRDALVRQAAVRADRAETGKPGTGQEGNLPLNDLQKSILAASHQLRADGHPANRPQLPTYPATSASLTARAGHSSATPDCSSTRAGYALTLPSGTERRIGAAEGVGLGARMKPRRSSCSAALATVGRSIS
jgi:phospholipase C